MRRLVRLRANSSSCVEFAGEIAAADQRADRGAGDHGDFDAGLVERAQHADMRPAARRTAAQRKRDAGSSLAAFGIGHAAGDDDEAVRLPAHQAGCAIDAQSSITISLVPTSSLYCGAVSKG